MGPLNDTNEFTSGNAATQDLQCHVTLVDP